MKSWHFGTILAIVAIYLVAVKFPTYGQRFWAAVGV